MTVVLPATAPLAGNGPTCCTTVAQKPGADCCPGAAAEFATDTVPPFSAELRSPKTSGRPVLFSSSSCAGVVEVAVDWTATVPGGTRKLGGNVEERGSGTVAGPNGTSGSCAMVSRRPSTPIHCWAPVVLV